MKRTSLRKIMQTFLISTLFSTALQAQSNILEVTDGTYTVPSESSAVLTLKSTASYDLICNIKVVGVIRGRDPSTGAQLTARQASDSVIGFILKTGRAQERKFNFVSAVKRMKDVWRDPQAVLVEVDPSSLTSDCQSWTGSTPNGGTCSWRGATVKSDQWLECPDCKYRYCQCQSNGSWGNCGNTQPSQGACDWSNPDWSNPACSEGGSKPCDWSNPDWSNPACQQ